MIKRFLSGMVVGVLWCSGLTLAAETQPGPTVQFQLDLAAQPMIDALNQFATQAGMSVVFYTEVTQGMMAPRIVGSYTADEALKRLLGPAGLKAEYLDNKTVAIRSVNERAAISAAGPQQTAIRLAQTAETDGPGEDSKETASFPRNSSEDSKPQLEEIVVTGTHIRGVTELAMPSLTFSRQDIDRTGYSRIEDLFRSLPQNLADIGVAVGEGASSIASDNTDRVAGIDLRGLGPQSTLVLLNGQRRAGSVQGRVVDVSAIPLSVIERVEVVTGGRSAIYGSDAVAGVVNLVTRRSFDGAESQVYFGEARAGGRQRQLSQIAGREAQRGGLLFAYDYADGTQLDATEAGIVKLPSKYGIIPKPGMMSLSPESSSHSGFFSGHFAATGSIELYADALYTVDHSVSLLSYAFPGAGDFDSRTATTNDQYSFAPGVRTDLGGGWTLDVAGVTGKAKNRGVNDFTGGSVKTLVQSGLNAASAVLDGSLLRSDAMQLSTAMGVDVRREDIESAYLNISSDRLVKSVFAETLTSLAPDAAGQYRVQLSAAGRYSHYSDFGSSFDPQFGIVWKALPEFSLRAAYSTAFRAPDLFSLNESFGGGGILIEQSDPQRGGAPIPVFIWLGKNSQLQPEEAKTWSVGLDYTPEFLPHSKFSASYFDIHYDKRLDEPASGNDRFVALIDESRYPGLIDRNPTAQQLDRIMQTLVPQGRFGNNIAVPFDPDTQQLLNVFPDLVLFDDRIHNIATEKMRGIDLIVSSSADSRLGALSFGLNATYYLDFDRQLSSTSTVFTQLNAQSKPVDFRVRASAGLERAAFGISMFLNYVDRYEDSFATPPRGISSWVTMDATLKVDGSELSQSGLFQGLTATLGVINLFDRAPPLVTSNTFGLGYDPANADALGRFVSLGVAKKW